MGGPVSILLVGLEAAISVGRLGIERGWWTHNLGRMLQGHDIVPGGIHLGDMFRRRDEDVASLRCEDLKRHAVRLFVSLIDDFVAVEQERPGFASPTDIVWQIEAFGGEEALNEYQREQQDEETSSRAMFGKEEGVGEGRATDPECLGREGGGRF